VSTALLSAGASAVIYGGREEKGIAYTGLEQALQDTQVEVRLFGKPEAFPRRRMGVALAWADSVAEARERAQRAAARVVPVSASP
jgi:phosphoribosylglycinamide formyltransferase 2